jgi:hypothetical protein
MRSRGGRVSATEVLQLLLVMAPLALAFVAAAVAVSLFRAEKRATRPTARRDQTEVPAVSPAANLDHVLLERLLEALATTRDRAELLDVVLESAVLVTGADAASAVLIRKDEPPLVRVRNLAAEALTVRDPPQRTVVIRYDYTDSEPEGSANAIATGVSVPLNGAGALATYWRSDHEPTRNEVEGLEALAARAAAAIEGAHPVEQRSEDAGVDGTQVDPSPTR